MDRGDRIMACTFRVAVRGPPWTPQTSKWLP
jgi:hypothetical protein